MPIRGVYGRYTSDLRYTEDARREYDGFLRRSSPEVAGCSRLRTRVRHHEDCTTAGAQYFHTDDCSAALVGARAADNPEEGQGGQAARFIELYRRVGMPQALRELRGAFSLLLVDRRSLKLYLAVDRLGVSPLYWSDGSGDLIVGPSADAVCLFRDSDCSVANQGLFNYLFFHMLPSPGTIYEQVSKLPAGHYLEYSGSRVETSRYWRPSFREQRATGKSQLQDQLFELMSRAVSRASADRRSCAFLSGGLDSSTVSGMLARSSRDPVDTFSIGFDAPGYDEIGYARIASEHFGTRAHEHYVTPRDVLDALPEIMAYYDEPFGNSSAIPAYYCAKYACEAGFDHILAGDGGDELFAGNARYAQQRIFEVYRRAPGWLRAGLIEPGVGLLPGANTLFRKAKSYIRQANIPLPKRLQEYNFVYRLGADAIFEPDFLSTVDQSLPQTLEDRLFEEVEEASSLNRMLYLDWHHTLADNDLRKVSRTCELAGIEVAFPMLDDELVDFSCGIPSSWKMPGNRLRGFFKDTVRGFVPAAIIDKKKHGFGLPFGVWMQEHRGLSELANDSLADMKKRGYLQSGLIDQAVDLHRNSHSAYYGELIWLLVALEIWLSSHGHG